MSRSPLLSASLASLLLGAACSGDDAGTTENATTASTSSGSTSTTSAPPETSATGAHGEDCADIETQPGTRVVAHRNGGGIRLEASRMAITCSSNADSLCSGEICYGYGVNTLSFPATLGVGSHDTKMLADTEVGQLQCTTCDYVGICAMQGGGPGASGTLVIEELTDDRIRGCIRSSEPCIDVAFDVEYC